MTMPTPSFAAIKTGALSRLKRHRIGLGIFVGLFVLFGLVGYLWLPGFAKAKMEEIGSEKLGRPLTVERIEIKPYTLEASLHGVKIGDPGREMPLISLESIYVNLSSMTFMRGAAVVSAVTIKKPEVHLVRTKAGKINLLELIEFLNEQPKDDSPPARFSVSNILLDEGQVVFVDEQKGSHQTITGLQLGLPFIANFESAEEVWVEPHLKALINGSAKVDLKGRAHPFADKREVILDVNLEGLDLTGVDEYFPLPQGLRLLSGKLDTRLALAFVQHEGDAPAISVSGDVGLRELAVSNDVGLTWKVAGESLGVHVDGLDPFLSKPFTAKVSASKLRMKQGDNPEMLIGTMAVNDIKFDPVSHATSFAMDASVNAQGSIKASGSAGWQPLRADVKLDVKEVDLVALQGWARNEVNATMTKGNASFIGDIKLSEAKAGLDVAVKGDAKLANFNLLDAANDDDLVNWRSLDLTGMAITTAPLQVVVAKISLADFFASVIFTSEGHLNLNSVMRQRKLAEAKQTSTTDKTTEKTATGTATEMTVTPPAVARPIKIGSILLQGGRLDFTDRFIKPNYRAKLNNLAGKIGPLNPGTPGLLDISGTVAKAPLKIQGKIDPFSAQQYLDITTKVKGIDLPGLSPYSSKYVGYGIEKGKLSVDVHYLIDKGELRAENNIFLDQLTFSDKPSSPDAKTMPVHLAVALLKNSRGEIDINLPISGSLNDPEFSIGGLVVKVIMNLLTKAITAPFALIGSMFGGGADLSQIDFAPGHARLSPEAEKGLDAIAKAMSERPALKIEVTGVADLTNDKEGLKRATLERRVKTLKLADMAKQGQAGGSVSEVVVAPAEYPKYLEQAYKNEKFDKPRNLIGMAKSLPVPEMEQLLLAHFPAEEEEMRNLAERRAKNAREALIAKGVSPERVFALQPKLDTPADKKLSCKVEFSLR